jgi:hypothetical protein
VSGGSRPGDIANQTRFDAAPLLRLVDGNVSELARRTGASRSNLARDIAEHGGFTLYTADRLAVGLGEHPLTLWPSWGDA